jgi:transglutaminase/protease-like cytokinesis protein 3
MSAVLEKKKAKELITENARDYLTAKVKIPLGNPALKNVHTNQFLFMTFPKEFSLQNWKTIAKALNSSDTRFSGYSKSRWYIEGCTIDVDAKGKAEMSLDLNAFASTTKEFTDGYRALTKAYEDATNKSTDTTSAKKTSSTKQTTNAVSNGKSVLNQSWIKKYKISATVYNKVKQICKAGDSDYNNVRAIFKWMDDNLPYEGYGGTRYGAAGTIKHGKGNCCDHAHLFAAMCRSIGVKCNYIHNPKCGRSGHVYNKVYIGNKSYIVDTGRDCASWGSHWGNAGTPIEKTSINF